MRVKFTTSGRAAVVYEDWIAEVDVNDLKDQTLRDLLNAILWSGDAEFVDEKVDQVDDRTIDDDTIEVV